MDRFKSIEAFVCIADLGSVSAAGRKLGISKSVVSTRLTQLEQLVGVRLFHRTSRAVRLTAAGRKAYPEYSELVARLSDIEAAPQRERAAISGNLRIACMVDAGVEEVSDLVGQFCAQHPTLRVELVLRDGPIDPHDDRFDIVLHYRAINSNRVIQIPLAERPTALYGSKAYLETAPPIKHPQDLLHHRCLGYTEQLGVHDWSASVWQFECDGTREDVRINLKSRTNSSLALKNLTLAGNGLSILPTERARSSQLVPLLTDWNSPLLTLFAAFPAANEGSAKVNALIEYLKSELISRADLE